MVALERWRPYALPWCLAAGLCLAWSGPAAAQEPECDNPPPADAPAPAGGPFTCPNSSGLDCDLQILANDLRLGDPVDAAPPERPRVSFSAAGNLFYAKLYSRFENVGLVPARTVAAVKVTFSYKATDVSTDTAGPWTAIPGGTYTMNIPASPSTPSGALYPGLDPTNPHVQRKAVCWHSLPGVELPRRFMLRAQLTWGHDPSVPGAADTSETSLTNNVAYKYYNLAAAKQAADIGLVLDLSGSMAEVQPADGRSKLEVAKDRAREFAALVEAGDRLGVYGFATDNPLSSPFTASYRDAAGASAAGTFNDTSQIYAPLEVTGDTERNAARAAIASQTAHGCTPVGQGLLRAKGGFAAAGGRSKSIVLFSDGLQNVPPFVNAVPSELCASPGSLPLISAANTFTADGVKVYSIYFGDVLWGYTFMQQLRMQTGGDFVYGASTGLQLAAAYYSIRNLLDDLLYLEENGTTSGPGPAAPFSVHFDAAAHAATVGIAWPLAAKAQLAVQGRRQGQSVWQTFEEPDTAQSTADAHRVYRFTPGPDTTWELRVVQLAPREGRVPYALAVYSDVEAARLEASLGAQSLSAGDPLPIFADLRRAGLPIAGAQVDAVVRLPARPVSTLLRRYAGRFTAAAGGDSRRISAMGVQLRQLLAQDGDAGELYRYREVAIPLRDDGRAPDRQAGDGVYSGALSGGENQVAGDVQVTVRAKGTTPSGFPFERAAKLATITGVGPADPARSEVRIAAGSALQGAAMQGATRWATVTVLPMDRFGNAAFPGSGSSIAVRPHAGGGTLVGSLADNQDTTFVHTLLLQPGEEPAVDVTVGGVPIGKGAAPSPLPNLRRSAWSLHLGIDEPQGAFTALADRGPSVAVDGEVRLDPYFALRAELGFSLFDKSSGSGTLALSHLVPYLQARRPGGVWIPYFEVGPGLYHLQGHGSAAGFAAGFGAQRILSPHWRWDLGFHAHRVGGSLDLSFSQLQTGVLYTH